MAKKQEALREGVTYNCTAVSTDGKIVGFAPRIKTVDLDEQLEIYTPEEIWKLADRQIDTDAKNAVRALFMKDNINASKAGKYLEENGANENGREVLRLLSVEKLSLVDAVKRVVGVDKKHPDAEQIHWSILPKKVVKEAVEESEVEESEEIEEVAEETEA